MVARRGGGEIRLLARKRVYFKKTPCIMVCVREAKKKNNFIKYLE